jgi:secreted trypsin-like serine protease
LRGPSPQQASLIRKLFAEAQTAGVQADATAVRAIARGSCQTTVPYKIVGGHVAIEKSQVTAATLKLIIRNQKYCIGTLIGPHHIVTAAHYMADVKDPKEVRIGSGLDGKIQEKLDVDGIKVHPLYVGILANDQAICINLSMMWLSSPSKERWAPNSFR